MLPHACKTRGIRLVNVYARLGDAINDIAGMVRRVDGIPLARGAANRLVGLP
jgi:hypothetical protein